MDKIILIILLIITIILLIVVIIKYLYITISLKEIKKRIQYLKDHETNILVDSASSQSDVREIVEMFNENLIAMNQLRQKINREELLLKNTITNISHDLRTPLTSILGYMKLLKQNYNHEYLQIIESRLEHLKTLVEELFNYSKIYEQDELHLEDGDITSILEEVIILFYNDFHHKKITPEIHLLDKPQIKKVDKLHLKRVFYNIINNALKHGKEEIIIIQKEEEIIFKNKTDNFDLIDVEKLFDRFFTVAKARSNGSFGLGLTIARHLINKMGGKIVAQIEGEYFIIIVRL